MLFLNQFNLFLIPFCFLSNSCGCSLWCCHCHYLSRRWVVKLTGCTKLACAGLQIIWADNSTLLECHHISALVQNHSYTCIKYLHWSKFESHQKILSDATLFKVTPIITWTPPIHCVTTHWNKKEIFNCISSHDNILHILYSLAPGLGTELYLVQSTFLSAKFLGEIDKTYERCGYTTFKF